MLNKLMNFETQTEEDQYEWGGGKKDKEAEEQKNDLKKKKKESPIAVSHLTTKNLTKNTVMLFASVIPWLPYSHDV